jgi:hypothetical protein
MMEDFYGAKKEVVGAVTVTVVRRAGQSGTDCLDVLVGGPDRPSRYVGTIRFADGLWREDGREAGGIWYACDPGAAQTFAAPLNAALALAGDVLRCESAAGLNV